MIRQSKIKQKKVLEHVTPRLEGIPSATGKEQRTSTNSAVADDAPKLKLKGHLVANMHRGGRKF